MENLFLKAKSYKLKASGGFTLIEMLVVITIISILAAVVLTGVSGFQSRARDTKRIADLAQVRVYLEAYFNRHNHYPGENDGDVATPTNWDTLVTALEDFGAAPNDPIKTRTYSYAVQTGENLSYVIGAKLENSNSAFDRTGEIDNSSFPDAHGGALTGAMCEDSIFGYCVSSQ